MAAGPDKFAQSWTPAEVVARIRRGDPGAEADLVVRYGRGVATILRRSASAPTVVDDLYQEVFLRALEKIRAGELREPERLSGFMCGLARNLAIDYFRRNPPAESLAGSDAGDLIPDQALGPLEQVLRIEAALSVRQVLAELPSRRDREVLWRFYIGEEEKEQICTDLKLTSLQFNRVLHRARERFRELYNRGSERLAASRER